MLKSRVEGMKLFAILMPVICSILLTILGCSSAEKKADTPEAAWAIAEEYQKGDRSDLAIKYYTELKNKFPYSKLAVAAELAIADIYFNDETYPEAVAAYQSFKDLHPKHSQTDYVTFRLGMSYRKQLPDTVDRDLSLSTQALAAFEELTTQFPQSTYVKEAQENKLQVTKMLAEKELYIADFYLRQKQYDSALARYKGLLSKFKETGTEAKGLKGAVIASHRLGQSDTTKEYMLQLEKLFPGSEELYSAGKEVSK